MRTVKKVISASILSLLGMSAMTAYAADTTLIVQTSTQSGGFSFQYLKDHWLPELEKRSDGSLKIQLMPIKSVMPRNETPEGVAVGILGGDLTSIAYFSGRNPAFAILGDLIGGYDSPQQVQDFCKNGGGAEVLQQTWDKVKPRSIHVVGCGAVSKEALVAKTPIRSVDDLKGIKIRSPEGLAAAVFRLAGASPVNIPFSEVFTSLEKGVVDAADASAYVNNDQNGFHQIAKYPLYPGIHSMAVHQFTVGKRTWIKLTTEQQTILTDWYYDAYADLLNALDKEDKKLVERDRAGSDIEVIDWAQEERDKFRAIAKTAWEKAASQSKEARAALDAHYKYMKSKGLL
ncbi:TRAP dicarboxylate transporter-DctP subunit [Vibrio nigripulchritudo SO65]|uniref:TRAP transporter substrate-binding protein DctP n=1 Tax=Vibrio nigripulchritudo TaxID=28173 RepID=UPI0003B2036C|nr:TRAP transporter substrate-binding protein DctP [Vibrio nigripulchritudo]CCN33604.1 TRAP dicarboxylate transporter-DctP subunit [Vibrio nigripulchritudo AM115]CCN44732.1 TRAP dicarboxylate transporter-DctP subunit [Vibrio nigripulchritudo FTn2]CCN62998.1 TRAP dicarboxylate transporter-DctP subunit [Vibrio nigripulchritudo POn4]CCN75126.1 TRAP dicarboxylate transporter-DctP subunit [Vibrio nigripulchritudo SO65]